MPEDTKKTEEAPQPTPSKLRPLPVENEANQTNRGAVVNPNVEPQRRVPEKRREGPFVQYVGPATIRRIAGNHWKAKVGAENVKEVNVINEWNRGNDYLLPVSDFTDHQLDYLLVEDRQDNGAHSFLEVDYNENGELVQAHTLQQ